MIKVNKENIKIVGLPLTSGITARFMFITNVLIPIEDKKELEAHVIAINKVITYQDQILIQKEKEKNLDEAIEYLNQKLQEAINKLSFSFSGQTFKIDKSRINEIIIVDYEQQIGKDLNMFISCHDYLTAGTIPG